MTTHDDTGKLTATGREALLKERAALEARIREMRAAPQAKSENGRRMDQEAMLALARQMVNIDKKLGR